MGKTEDFMRMHALDITALSILIISGVNAGLTAIFSFDPVAAILGGYDSIIMKAIYLLIAVSAIRVFYKYLMTPGEDIV